MTSSPGLTRAITELNMMGLAPGVTTICSGVGRKPLSRSMYSWMASFSMSMPPAGT